MRRERIVYTRPDGGVAIVVPSANCMRWMSMGGRWGTVTRGWVEEQIARFVASGRSEDVSRRFVHALLLGGKTDREALELIRDKDAAPYGSAIELWDMGEVPADRWFRDAWKRSANGGPISIDLRKARLVQLDRIKGALAQHNSRRLALGRSPAIVQWGEIRSGLRLARDHDDVRRVWPSNLRGAHGA